VESEQQVVTCIAGGDIGDALKTFSRRLVINQQLLNKQNDARSKPGKLLRA
jgi:hypothetical protein